MTKGSSSISRPRAATPVAINSPILPDLKSARIFSRTSWLLPPWIHSAIMPRFSSWLTSFAAPCLVSINISACCQLFSLIKWLNNADFLSLSTVVSHCSIFGLESVLAMTDISTGRSTVVFANAFTWCDSVAENSKLCLSVGSLSMILSMSSIKPISSILSASSSTRISSSSK